MTNLDPCFIHTRKDALARSLRWMGERPDLRVHYHGRAAKSSLGDDATWGDVRQAIVALGEDPDLDAVDLLTGTPIFTRQTCHECYSGVCEKVIGLGDQPADYDTASIDICLPCLEKALKRLRAAS